MKTTEFFAKTVKLPKELKQKLEKERLKIKPSPSLHAFMIYKLSK